MTGMRMPLSKAVWWYSYSMAISAKLTANSAIHGHRRRDSTELEIVLRQGINRQIRRVLAKLGHPVIDLRRVAIGPIADPDLKARIDSLIYTYRINAFTAALALEQMNRVEDLNAWRRRNAARNAPLS